ncbi:MAG: hypothetical protein AABM33_14270 [Pseudomonadota bacterium]
MVAVETNLLVYAHRAGSSSHAAALRLLTVQDVAVRGRIEGGAIHDARIAALCLHHGVKELWTVDRDFSRFPALRVRNPLVS